MLWRFAERCGAQGVRFIVELVLARILVPDDYGAIALVTVFIELLNVFVDSGMGNALIQKKDADDVDFSSVFYFNILLCVCLYGLLFAVSPAIANFYKRPNLAPVLRVLGLQVIISGVKNVQQAYVSRTMQFKRFFFATLGGTLGAAVVGIFMAYRGYGVWALVGQQLFNTLVGTAILWITVKWRPQKVFSVKRLKTLFGFGWKLLVSSLLDTGYRQLRQLIIGKLYTSEDLAFYNRGEQFPQLFVSNVNSAIDSVLLPAMSSVQDDRERVRSMTRQSIKVSTYVMAPLMMGLAFVSTPLVRLLLTEKWLFCVPYLRIFCVAYMFQPIHTANLNAIKAMGRSDLFLKLEIIKKTIGLVVLFTTIRYGVLAMAYSLLATNVIAQIINAWPNRKLLQYSYLEQMKDIMPCILLATAMGVGVNLITWLKLSDILTLLLQIPLGIMLYVAGSMLLRLESFGYLLGLMNSFLRKKET